VGTPNLLLVVLDALRFDASRPTGEPDRSLAAARCVAAAPWTLPSCSSLLTGLDATVHRHYWVTEPLPANDLVASLPDRYTRVGIVNNSVLTRRSGLAASFQRWRYCRDHAEPFERALRLIRTAKSRRPLFLVLHSNIPHDYYLDDAIAYHDEAFPRSAGQGWVLGDRVISWDDADVARRDAVRRTYDGCVEKTNSYVVDVLDAVRQRDDFVTAVTSDHGEGLEPEIGRVHHAGRMHQDLLHVPLCFDVPSRTPGALRDELAATLASRVISNTEVVPLMIALSQNGRSRRRGDRRIGDRPDQVAVSEDRRYLYFKDRFRFNYHGRYRNMSPEQIERNRGMLEQLSEPPLVRAYQDRRHKLVVTALRLNDGGPGTDQPRLLERYGAELLGSPVRVRDGSRLIALESFDLEADPGETANLSSASDWAGVAREWDDGRVTLPDPDGRETPLVDVLARSEPMEMP
jgi:arylsulfatase A-like enzyme